MGQGKSIIRPENKMFSNKMIYSQDKINSEKREREGGDIGRTPSDMEKL